MRYNKTSIIETIVSPLYLDIFSFWYEDMEDVEKEEFYVKLKNIVSRAKIENELKILSSSIEYSNNWRVRVVISWLSIVLELEQFQPYISECLLDENSTDTGGYMYVYAMLEFDNEQSINVLQKFAKNKAKMNLDNRPFSGEILAKVALSILQNDTDMKNEDTIWLLELKSIMKEIKQAIRKS